MAIYMEFEGVKGNVTVGGYEGMIKLDFVTFGVQRTISMQPGELANREYNCPIFSIIKTGKKLDVSTPGLLRESAVGHEGKQVKLHFVRTQRNALEEYMSYTLENCLITGINQKSSRYPANIPVERVYLSYSAITITHGKRDANDRITNTLRAGYDLTNAVGL